MGPMTDSQPRASSRPTASVELLVKDGCHLCADAVAVVEEVCGRLGVEWRSVDVADHPDLAERHAEEIPVLLVDGIQRDFWRIDPIRFERLLTAGRA